MKRIRTLIVVAMLSAGVASVSAATGDHVNLEAGSTATFFNEGSVAWCTTEIGHGAGVGSADLRAWLTGRGIDTVTTWPSMLVRLDRHFAAAFNSLTSRRKGMVLQTGYPDERLQCVVRINRLFGDANRVSIDGLIDLVDTSSSEAVCRMSFRGVEASMQKGDVASGLMQAFELLALEAGDYAWLMKNAKLPTVATTPVVPLAITEVHDRPAAGRPGGSGATAARSNAPAEQHLATVTFKNGTRMVGEIKGINPMGNVTLVVSGIEMSIPMEQVQSIETKPVAAQAQTPPPTQTANITSASRRLAVTDDSELPDAFSIRIGDRDVRMLLVRGGQMKMGYDGDGSMSMCSEPVHTVNVTSFYISSEPMPIMQGMTYGYCTPDENGLSVAKNMDDAKDVISAIAKATGHTYRLPTEAEWEYAAQCDLQQTIFAYTARTSKIALEWTGDYWGEYSTGGVQTDPTGPMSGKQFVVRAYSNDAGKFNRSDEVPSARKATLGYVRLVIKAADIIR